MAIAATGDEEAHIYNVHDGKRIQSLIDRPLNGTRFAQTIEVDQDYLVIGTPLASVQVYRLRRYQDVSADYWAFSFIERLAEFDITVGCGGKFYCPDALVTRAQMAVFLERGIRGSDYVPPAATGNVFLDVSANDFAANFIEQFYQMAVFLLRAKHGSGYSPPVSTGVFNDVDSSYWAADWIEQLAAEGITAGCGNGNYCPEASVTRAQMAVFLVRTFGL